MADAKIVIGGDSTQAKKALKEVGEESAKLSSAISLAAAAAAAAFAAFTAVVVKGIAAYREQELAVNSLNQALASQGIFSKELSTQYQKQASELQKLTIFGDEAILQAQTRIQAYIGEQVVTKDLTLAVLNYAQATGKDLVAASDAVGKSIGTQTNVLVRSGIEIDANASSAEKLTQVTKQLNARFGGQAEAAAQGLGGIDQLKNAYGDLFELVGQDLSPIFSVFIKQLSSSLDAFQTSAESARFFGDSFEFIASEVSNTVTLIQGFIAVLVGPLTSAVTASSALLAGNFSQAKDIIANTFTSLGEELTAIADANSERQAQFANARLEAEASTLSREAALLETSERNKIDVRKKFDEEELQRRNDLALIKQDEQLLQGEIDLALDDQKLALQIQQIEQKLALEQDAQTRSALIAQRGSLKREQIERAAAKAQLELDQKSTQARLNVLEAFGNLAASIGGRGAKAAFLIQKGAAIAGSIVATNLATAKAFASAPPPANIALAAATKLAGNINTAAIIATAITGFAKGGLVQGGISGRDSVPAMLTPGELVVPQTNFDEVINAVSNQRAGVAPAGAGMMEVIIGFRDQAFEIIEQKLIERRAEGIGFI